MYHFLQSHNESNHIFILINVKVKNIRLLKKIEQLDILCLNSFFHIFIFINLITFTFKK